MAFLYPILLALLALLFFWLCTRNLKTGIFLFAALLPSYVLRVYVADIPIRLVELYFAGLALAWLLNKGWKDLDFSRSKSWVYLAVALLVAGLISVVTSGLNGGWWLKSLNVYKLYLVEPIIFVGILLSTLKKRSDWLNLLLALAVGAIPLAFFAVAQVWFGFPIPSPYDYELRATSLFLFPNALGLYLAPIASVSAVLAFVQRSKLWLLLFVASFLACILAETEAALVAIPGALALTFVWVNWNHKRLRLVSIGFIGLALTAAMLVPATRSKLLLQDYSGQVRISQWVETKDFLLDHAIFGAGLFNYPTAFAPYHQNTMYEIFQYPHNLILNVWVELGLLGVLILITFVWLVLASTINKKAPLNSVFLAGILTMLIHGLVDVPFFKDDLAFLTALFVAGLVFISERLAQEEELKLGIER